MSLDLLLLCCVKVSGRSLTASQGEACEFHGCICEAFAFPYGASMRRTRDRVNLFCEHIMRPLGRSHD